MTNGTPLKDAGDRFDRLHQILLEHPRLDGIRTRIHWLMQRTESMIAKTEARRVAARLRPIKTEELWILPLIGPSGAMKSTSIAKVTDEILADPKYSDDQIPVLVVSMRDVRTPKDFVAQILDAYNDAGAEDTLKGKLNARKVAKKIYNIARTRGTVLLVVDEGHEMLRHDGGKVGDQMASLLKTMVNECVFSILLVGTEALKPLFKSLEALNRAVPDHDCDLRPFDIANRADCEYFFPFLKMLEDRLVEDGVVDRPLGWVDSVEDCARIYDMSGGILGTPCRVLFMALDRAFRAGRPYLLWDDISKAFGAYNQLRPANERTFDPFVKGPRTESVATLSRMLT
ncbi:hypothetical protein ACVI1J_006635 [Bradyrhizobium diazoefficiens]